MILQKRVLLSRLCQMIYIKIWCTQSHENGSESLEMVENSMEYTAWCILYLRYTCTFVQNLAVICALYYINYIIYPKYGPIWSTWSLGTWFIILKLFVCVNYECKQNNKLIKAVETCFSSKNGLIANSWYCPLDF